MADTGFLQYHQRIKRLDDLSTEWNLTNASRSSLEEGLASIGSTAEAGVLLLLFIHLPSARECTHYHRWIPVVMEVSRPLSSAPSTRSPRTKTRGAQQQPQRISVSSFPQEMNSQHRDREETKPDMATILSSSNKIRKEKVLMMKPRQLSHLPPCVYKEQCRQARIKFEVIKQKKALKALLQAEEQDVHLRRREEQEQEKAKDHLNELRFLHIKNLSIVCTRACIRDGRKNALAW
jgi:hypothetical protein